MARGGVRENAGRKPVSEEKQDREAIKKLFPKAISVYEQMLEGRNEALKQKVAQNIINKFVSDMRPDETDFIERLDRLEELILGSKQQA